jgi:hypothetical protein
VYLELKSIVPESDAGLVLAGVRMGSSSVHVSAYEVNIHVQYCFDNKLYAVHFVAGMGFEELSCSVSF